jgi:hypothetical protein
MDDKNAREIGKRIIRPATPEEKARHQQIREEIAAERGDIDQWAKRVAAKYPDDSPLDPKR